MYQDNRWLRMLKPGITAIVGAGGKTTVLERLGKYGHNSKLPIMISSTVPMDSAYIDNVEPFDVICTSDVEKEKRSAQPALPTAACRPGFGASMATTATQACRRRSSNSSRYGIRPGISSLKETEPRANG